ncbi:PilZ domain-containing protein [Yoonia sp. 208BN28-4]|uniref:PilZ domain-containing protein n=1 Tax=Yoonia sp. 208BN28-4 TaxID=3126505 RepID=UPI00309B4D84
MQFRDRRYPAEFDARVMTPDGVSPARILDVNAKGAQIRLDTPLQAGSTVRLAILGDTLTAKIRWTHDGRAGIAFQPMIPQAMVDRISHCFGTRTTGRRFDSSHLMELR